MEKTAQDSNTFYNTMRIIIDLLYNKLLYFFILGFSFMSTFFTYKTLKSFPGVFVYYVADNSIVGNIPNRLFGLFSHINIDYGILFSAFKASYFVIVPVLAHSIYLHIKKQENIRNRILFFSIVFIPLKFFIKYWGHEIFLMPFIISLAILFYAYYILFYKEKNYWAAILLAVIAEIVDCRSVLLILPLCAVLYFKIRDKKGAGFKKTNIIICVAVILSLALISFTSISSDVIDDDEALFEKRIAIRDSLPQHFDDETKQMYYYIFIDETYSLEAYISYIPIGLVANSLDRFICIPTYVLDDMFQLNVLIFIIMILAELYCQSIKETQGAVEC